MIYLDNNATTFIDPHVFEAMRFFYAEEMGNPSSVHQFGQRAKGILTSATQSAARFFNVRSDEILFTSGATEALNLLIRGIPKGGHVITSSIEHIAVLESLKYCGGDVTYLDPEPLRGAITVSQVKKAIQSNTEVIVLMGANNETGVRTDIEAIAKHSTEIGASFIVDGVALLGKEQLSIPDGVSAICFSGHKVHAPTGIGVAVVRKGFKFHPLIVGGPQQRGMRGGTENLAGIIGFTKALELLEEHGEKWSVQMRYLRDRFENRLLENLPDLIIHGMEEKRICNTSNIAFLGVDGETLLMSLDLAGVAASHGSACQSGTLEPSRVLLNMGISSEIARSSIRFSFSRFTTQEEIDKSVSIITEVASRLRQLTF